MDAFAEQLKRRLLYSHVRETETGCTLLDYLVGHYDRWDAANWRREIQEGKVTVNGHSSHPAERLKRHDKVGYFPEETEEPEAELAYRTVYADADLLVIDKPGNLCVHPTGPFFRHTLWHLVGSDYGEIHFVNRLDRETSGLLVAARNRRTAARLDQYGGPMRKEYLALVFGHFRGSFRARGVLAPDADSVIAKKRCFHLASSGTLAGEAADTELHEEARVAPDMTLVRAILHTGRQHQIRATLYALGYPLVGDKLYGPDERLFLKIRSQTLTPEDLAVLRMERQALHSAVLAFAHPLTGAPIRCESPFHYRLLDRP